MWEGATPNDDVRDGANHRTYDKEAEDVDTILPRAKPIPRTLHRVALEDNDENGGDAGQHHQASESEQDSAERLAGKKPVIGRDDGAFDEGIGSEVAKIADVEGYADT